MPASRKPYHKYPVSQSPEPEKYLPSFFLEVPFDNLVLQAEIRPLRKDVGYFTVNINHVFMAHIHKMGETWKDFVGATSELYQVVGSLIDEHLNK
jgi:hypothetical protein